MGEDIGEKLLSRIQELFRKSVMEDENIRMFLAAVKAGKAGQQDCLRYAERLGEHLSMAFAEVLTAENLPNGTLYFNIANKTILPMLREAHMDINTQASAVQKAIDQAMHIGLQPLSGSFPESRVRDLMYTMCNPDLPKQKTEAYLTEPIVNTCASFFDDFVRENADFRFRSGMSPTITRIAVGGCCKWCANLAGIYPYEKVKGAGHDVFRRHEHCRCVTTFENGRKSQNVWSKKQWTAEPDELERRKALAQKQHVNSPQDRIRASEQIQKVDNSGIDIIIKDGLPIAASSRYLNSHDPILLYSKNLTPLDGYEDIVVHGSEFAVSFLDSSEKESTVSAKEFAEILRKDPNYHGGNIRLISCRTAAGDGIIPQYLADTFRVSVIAPTETVYIFPDGRMILSDKKDLAFSGIETGSWKIFTPKG